MKFAVLMGVAALAIAGPVSAETWQVFSRSPNNVYMAEVDGILVEGEISSIRVATVSGTGEADDLSHSIETYQFRCGSADWRTAGIVEFGPDGTEAGQYPEEGAAWESVRPNTVPAYLKQITCDGVRAVPPHWPTVQAFVEAGRPDA
jgi:hypothetical protein